MDFLSGKNSFMSIDRHERSKLTEMADVGSPNFLFRRCLQCPPETPACPNCPSGQTCSLLTRTCDTCASTTCISDNQASNGGSNSGGGGPNIGAIAGGVAGGVVFIVVISFLIWKFWFKGKRRPIEEDYDIGSEKMSTHNPNFGMHRSGRNSTHTVQSMASTVLTRASNIIQIAYIPGVTNRSTASPGALVPPVPPIPSATPTSPYRDMSPTEDQVFFTAGDIRDSTYSGTSTYVDGNGRQSIAPSLARSSVATTIYRGQAQVSPLPAPTRTMVRGKAAVVNVAQGSKTPSLANSPIDAPPVPSIDFAKHSGRQSPGGSKLVQVQIPTSTDALGGLSPSSSMQGAISAKPVALNIKKRPGYGRNNTSQDAVPTSQSIADAISKAAAADVPAVRLRAPSAAGTVDSGLSHARARQVDDNTEAESSDDDANPHERSRRSLLGDRSPFSDSARVPSSEATPILAAIPDDRQAGSSARPGSGKREQSPFADEHAVKSAPTPRYSGSSWQSS